MFACNIMIHAPVPMFYVTTCIFCAATTADETYNLPGDATPNIHRRSMFTRAVNTLRASGGKGSNCMNNYT